MMITDTGLRGRGRSGCPPLIADSGGASRVSEHFGGTGIRVRVRSGVYAATCWTRKKLRFKRERQRQIKVRNCQEIEFPLARFLSSPVAPPCSLPLSPNETVALLFFLCLIAVVLPPHPPPHVCVSRTHIICPDGHALST